MRRIAYQGTCEQCWTIVSAIVLPPESPMRVYLKGTCPACKGAVRLMRVPESWSHWALVKT